MPIGSNIKNPIAIKDTIEIVFNKAKNAYPSLGFLEFKTDENILIDTMPKEFGTLSLRYKLNSDTVRSAIKKNMELFKEKYPQFPPNVIDVDTLWYSCSAYFDYSGKNSDHICSMRNGFQYSVDEFMSKEMYDDLQNGMAFVIQNSLLIASKNNTIKDIDNKVYNIMASNRL